MTINMEYPTWDEISKVLNVSGIVNPVEVYGNTALALPDNPTCVCNNRSDYKNGLVGIDIPVLLSQKDKESKGIIIILGESPLRSKNDEDSNNNVVFGLPYAVHMDINNPPQSRMYKNIFLRLLDAGYSVYLTDIIKAWWAGKKLDPKKEEIDLFKEELKTLQGGKSNRIFIVAFGKKAEGAIEKIKKQGVNIGNPTYLPHPSKLNWDTWKLKIFEEAVFSGNPGHATQWYPTPNSPTTENIIVEVAAAEILKNIM